MEFFTHHDLFIGRQNYATPNQGNRSLTLNGGTWIWNTQAPNDENAFAIGNHDAMGTVTLDAGTFFIGRDESGAGRQIINGGVMSCKATTFDKGNGVLNMKGNLLASIAFGAGGGDNSINFLAGFDGQLKIHGWTQAQFDSLSHRR